MYSKQALVFMTLQKNPFENMVRKGENADNQRILLFPPYQRQIEMSKIYLVDVVQNFVFW